MDTRSKEYVEWMANVWKLNDERNKEIERKKRESEKSLKREKMLSLSEMM
jgi:hypothetical protein